MTVASALESWIMCRNPSPQARLRLFCFPYAGGGASIFRAWSDGLPADVEVCPIQLPGRGTRLMEPPFTQFSPLAPAVKQQKEHIDRRNAEQLLANLDQLSDEKVDSLLTDLLADE
jgi:surfactin synthase thioesterase subunit